MKYVLKPVIWNTKGYRRPAGVPVDPKSYPGETGYGGEEWNHSAKMLSLDGSVRYFHVEPVGDTTGMDGHIMLFMYASHDGIQELVGIAARATRITDRDERRQIRSKIDIEALADDAWSLPRVKLLHRQDRARFDKVWRASLDWLPGWRCPADHFLWLKTPAQLDPPSITGAKKLNTRFTSYTAVNSEQAEQVLNSIPEASRGPKWAKLRDLVLSDLPAGPDNVQNDVDEVKKTKGLPATTKKLLIDARLGQGRFRNALDLRWNETCAVTGCGVRGLLRASHIKPWKIANNEERLDPDNGLLLVATLDAAFDRGLISFADDGAMLVSRRLPRSERIRLSIAGHLSAVPVPAQRDYLRSHRKRFGFDL
jgi:hypothetical protein